MYWHRKDPNYFEPITNIPLATQKLIDIINEQFTYKDLCKNDELEKSKIALKDVILDMENEVLANAGVDVFEEVFKLIFAKLYDELTASQDDTSYLRFRNAGYTDFELKEKIQELFNDANRKWYGVFDEDSKIILSPLA